MLEARRTQGACTCDGNGRRAVPEESTAAKEAVLDDDAARSQGLDCVCEIEQATGDDLVACLTDPDPPVTNAAGPEVHGWCYVEPPRGEASIVAGCPDTQRRLIRLVGDGQGQAGATLYVTCSEA